jgi:hypothetical protein
VTRLERLAERASALEADAARWAARGAVEPAEEAADLALAYRRMIALETAAPSE